MIKFIDILNEDIFLQSRKSPEEKARVRELEMELEYKQKFSIEIYEGDIELTKGSLPHFKKYSKIKKVNGYFNCSWLYLSSLTELPIPNYIMGDFDCYGNKLTSLQGAPEEVGGNFSCYNNPTQFTQEDVRRVCDVKGEIFT